MKTDTETAAGSSPAARVVTVRAAGRSEPCECGTGLYAFWELTVEFGQDIVRRRIVGRISQTVTRHCGDCIEASIRDAIEAST